MKTIRVSIKGQNPARQTRIEDRKEERKIPTQQIFELESEQDSHNTTKTITVSIPEKLWTEFGMLINIKKINKGEATVEAIRDYVDKNRDLFDLFYAK